MQRLSDWKTILMRLYDEEQVLIKKSQAGDMQAFEQLYYRYNDIIYRSAYLTLHSVEDAKDAVQNVFVRVYKSIGKFRFNSQFKTYLYRILMNVCIDIKKKRSMHFLPQEQIEMSKNDSRLDLEKAISCLPDRMRECFILFAVEDIKQSEIANILGISEGTVKAHISQAKQKIKFILNIKEL